VSFDAGRLKAAVNLWNEAGQSEISGWQHVCHYFDGTEEAVRWIFVLDLLNHCFWPDHGDPAWTVVYRGKPYSGYWGLAASLKRAKENGFPLTDADYLADISAGDLERIFSGEGSIPLFDDRLRNLREAGRIIRSEWQGDIVHLVEAGRGSAAETVREVVGSFPSFRDEARYRGEDVYFWKRAQLFVSDLHAAFQGRDWGRFEGMGDLTAFADYKLPQVLRAMGLISYDPDLESRVDRGLPLEPGSEEEVEIRAATIWAVEALKGAFSEAGIALMSTQIDNWLWQLGQLEPFRRKPYHRCRTIFY
jgi:hypothetical protein